MIDIELIPRIMRNFGMRRGQQLMETWFSRVAARYPYYNRPVTNIITMDWALSFERVRNVYDNSDKRRRHEGDRPVARSQKAAWKLPRFPNVRRLTQPVPTFTKSIIDPDGAFGLD